MKLIGRSSPSLTKFCPPEFNIRKDCNTIRIGTLYGFRAIENEQLRDAGEGTFRYSVEFPEPTKVSHEWISAFEVEGGAESGIDSGVEANITGFSIMPDGVVVESMSLSGSCHNCWIYCLSKSSGSAGNISDTHQDKWSISIDKLEEFANYLAVQLLDSLVFSDLPESIANDFGLLELGKRLSVKFEIRDVGYGSREVHLLSEDDLPISEIEFIRDSVAFIKPKMFVDEREVRIAFWLYFDNKRISISGREKFISLRPIDKII